MEILLRENGYSYIITKKQMLLCLLQRTRECQREALRHEWERAVSWQLLMTTKPWLLTAVGSCQWFIQVKVPQFGDKPKSMQRDSALATLKASSNVDIFSSYGWCSSCIVGQPLWLRLPQVVFPLSAGAFQDFPGARQSSSVQGQHCAMQHTAGANAARVQAGGAAQESSLLLCSLGFLLLSCLKQIRKLTLHYFFFPRRFPWLLWRTSILLH